MYSSFLAAIAMVFISALTYNFCIARSFALRAPWILLQFRFVRNGWAFL